MDIILIVIMCISGGILLHSPTIFGIKNDICKWYYTEVVNTKLADMNAVTAITLLLIILTLLFW